MIMWVMSDRAHPAQLPDDGGLRRPHLPARQRRRQVALREVPLEAAARRALARVGRGAEDRRQGPRLPPPRPVGRDRERRTSRSGSSGVQVVEEKDELDVRLRPARPDQARPRGARAGAARRQADARTATPTTSSPRPSRSPSTRATSCRASTSPTTRCCRAGCSRTSTRSSPGSGGPNFHEIPINRPLAPVHNNQRDGHMRQTINAGQVSYHPNSLGGSLPAQADTRCRRLRHLPRRGRGREGPSARRKLLRPLQPGADVLQQPVRAGAAAPRQRAPLRARQR